MPLSSAVLAAERGDMDAESVEKFTIVLFSGRAVEIVSKRKRTTARCALFSRSVFYEIRWVRNACIRPFPSQVPMALSCIVLLVVKK